MAFCDFSFSSISVILWLAEIEIFSDFTVILQLYVLLAFLDFPVI